MWIDNGNVFMWRHQQEHTEAKGLSACENGMQINKSSAPLDIHLYFHWAHGFGLYWDSTGPYILTRIDALPALEGLQKGMAEICMWLLTQRTWRDNCLSLSSTSLHRIHPNTRTWALRWPRAGQTARAFLPSFLPSSLATGLTSWASHTV